MESDKLKKDKQDHAAFKSDDEPEYEKPNLKGDYGNLLMLFVLYVLQGVPMGISASMTVMLQNRGVSYFDQTIFSIAYYPFTFKILWAPIIDSVFIECLGRRKTWLIPTQLLIGLSMIYLSQRVDSWFGDGVNEKPRIYLITIIFFFLWFLTATQDIAVDGWAITMLQRRNVGYAATVNNIGQSFGVLSGFVIFLMLESKDFCNKYIFSEPQEEGLLKLSGCLLFWGVMFLVVNFFVALFKKEKPIDLSDLDAPDVGIKKCYPVLWKIVRLKPILKLASVLSFADICTATVDVVTNLKLIDYGVPRDKLAIFNIPSFVVQLILPAVISRYTAGGKYPLRFYVNAFPFQLVLACVIVTIVYFTPTLLAGRFHNIPNSYYAMILTVFFVYQIAMRSKYSADMAFFARIADPLMAGTYMTLMNVIYVGSKIFKSLTIWLVDVLTWRSCYFESDSNHTIPELVKTFDCTEKVNQDKCLVEGGQCLIDIDGYYIEFVINTILGLFWIYRARRIISKLEKLPLSHWHVLSNQKYKDYEKCGTELEKIGKI